MMRYTCNVLTMTLLAIACFTVRDASAQSPGVVSIEQVCGTPPCGPTNADRVVWFVYFSEKVTGVSSSDFTLSFAPPISDTQPTLSVVRADISMPGDRVGSLGYELSVAGESLEDYNGTVTLSFASGYSIRDLDGHALTTITVAGTNEPTWVLDNEPPGVKSIERQDPQEERTKSDTLTWRVTFSEDMTNVTDADFTVVGTTAALAVAANSKKVYDVTASGENIADLNATVTLGFASNIKDLAGNALTNTTPPVINDNTYIVDHAPPVLTSITRQSPTVKITGADELTWRVTFDELVWDVDGGTANVSDFLVTITPAPVNAPTLTVTIVDQVLVEGFFPASDTWDLKLSGGDLATLSGTVTLTVDDYVFIDVSNLLGPDPPNELNSLGTLTPTGTNDNTFVMDNPRLKLSTTYLTVAEGSTETYTVRLATKPSDAVTVAVASDNTAAATVSPASLAFTAANWSTAQTVTVTGVLADGSATITHTASGAADYANLKASLTVSVKDPPLSFGGQTIDDFSVNISNNVNKMLPKVLCFRRKRNFLLFE